MSQTFRKLFALLDRRERVQFALLLALFLFTGLMEVLGIASILPFLAVLSNPQLIHSNKYIAQIFDELGFTSRDSFLFFLSVVVFVILVVRTSFNALTQYALQSFSQMRNYALSTRLLRAYMQRPYSWYLDHHSAELGKNILSEVEQVSRNMFMPALRLLSQLPVAVLVITFVVMIEPFIALVSAAIIGAVYALVYTGVRNFLLQIGKERLAANKERFLLAQEATGGIKQVKVMGLEGEYIRRFRKSALSFAKHQVSSATIGLLPRYVLELVIFGGMLFLIMLLLVVRGEGNFEAILPLLGVFAVAGYRLLPALQQIFQSLTKLRFHRPALDRIFDDLAANGRSEISIPNVSISQRLGLRESLELTDVAFTYPHAVRPALQHITITIPANTTLGLVGPTGAGKSTFVDLVLGLLQAQHGLVHVDGVPITKTNVRAWQRSIGYVPQRIFLTDDTVARNIAFGVPEAKIDMDAVKDAAQIADLHAFISGELPDGYQSMIGECGVRLSGGQRQRLGIARALYHTPDVLVLDEATSSLDNITERSVMDAIHNLGHKKTIILVAHRLTTVKLCDQILLFEDGRISASGTYDQLLRASRNFHAMAEMST